ANIPDQVISLSEFVKVNKQNHNWRFMSVQLLQAQVILFTYGYEGGDDDEAGNEISSANSYGVTVGYWQVC
ncbi:MAG: hypothetical protein ACKO2Z_25755, partial [Sphaerospermopsis kisseleviana]